MLNLIVRLAQTIPTDIQEQVEEITGQINSNPTLKWTLLGIGIFCVLVFLFGILKHAFKAAFLFAILSVAAWIWFFNVHG